eukprot:Hpha_TRINITY_DN13146_c0_g1::TRINITY_DN13146_c0_g1_i1::g.113653::m.113653
MAELLLYVEWRGSKVGVEVAANGTVKDLIEVCKATMPDLRELWFGGERLQESDALCDTGISAQAVLEAREAREVYLHHATGEEKVEGENMLVIEKYGNVETGNKLVISEDRMSAYHPPGDNSYTVDVAPVVTMNELPLRVRVSIPETKWSTTWAGVRELSKKRLNMIELGRRGTFTLVVSHDGLRIEESDGEPKTDFVEFPTGETWPPPEERRLSLMLHCYEAKDARGDEGPSDPEGRFTGMCRFRLMPL